VSAAVSQPIVAVRGVSKRYGGVQALAGVDFDVHPGRVTALLGENGAGKSTLMKLLAGAEQPDEGTLLTRGTPTTLSGVQDARRHGIAIVFQELALFPDLDVLANLFSGAPAPARLGLVDRRAMAQRAAPVLEQIGLDVPLSTPLAALRLGERQLVEIARALLQESDVLILDEPNSALNTRETERLLSVVGGLRARGVAVVYISHRLEEVFRIADEVTVLRNGRVVDRRPTVETSIPEVVRAMIGREPTAIATNRAPAHRVDGEPARLVDVTVPGRLDGVCLEARPGEVVGLAGLEGAGMLAVFDVLFGQAQPSAGAVRVAGVDRPPRSVREAVRRGIARVQSDRRRAGVALEQSVLENLSHVTAGVLRRYGPLPARGRLRARARARCEDLSIRTASLAAPVRQLSGGNQQKVALGKWLEAEPRVVLLDDPTRGVDVGAKAEIYALVRRLADDGRVVLFASSELLEYALLCDRVVVFHRGRVRGELAGHAADEHRLLEAINTGAVPGAAGPAALAGAAKGGSR